MNSGIVPRRGELTTSILRAVDEITSKSALAGTLEVREVINFFHPENRHQRNQIWKAIKYLESRDRLKVLDDGLNTSVMLTRNGRTQLHEDSIQTLEIRRPSRWDKKWRLVMFDLPMRHGNVRQAFRHKLQDFGFKMYQKSVFIYPYECLEEVNTVAHWYGVKEYVRYIVASEIHDIRKFVVAFDLL